MDGIEKGVLAAVYVSGITGRGLDAVLGGVRAGGGPASRALDALAEDGLVEQDRRTISKRGRESLKVVLAGGVFDVIHPGHIHTLGEARKLGDVLAVVIATDRIVAKMKKPKPLHGQEQRRLLVESLGLVDAAVVGDDSDIFRTVDLIRPQIIALGYDQVHQEKAIIDGCKKINLGVTVARLQSPVPGMSSSAIKEEYGDGIHGT